MKSSSLRKIVVPNLRLLWTPTQDLSDVDCRTVSFLSLFEVEAAVAWTWAQHTYPGWYGRGLGVGRTLKARRVLTRAVKRNEG
jgi:hypothetical protein